MYTKATSLFFLTNFCSNRICALEIVAIVKRAYLITLVTCQPCCKPYYLVLYQLHLLCKWIWWNSANGTIRQGLVRFSVCFICSGLKCRINGPKIDCQDFFSEYFWYFQGMVQFSWWKLKLQKQCACTTARLETAYLIICHMQKAKTTTWLKSNDTCQRSSEWRVRRASLIQWNVMRYSCHALCTPLNSSTQSIAIQ